MVFRVRKFAVRLIPDVATNGVNFTTFFNCLHEIRDLKNYIIPVIISHSNSADFEKSGNIPAKQLYNRINGDLIDILPKKFANFKERLRRNVFFEVYDLIRAQWVRNGWLTQIISFLSLQSSTIQLQFLQNKLNIRIRHQLLRQLRHQYSNRSAGFSIGYLNNLLQELRNQLYHLPTLQQMIWQSMVSLRSDASLQGKIRKQLQTGWIRQQKKQAYELLPSEIIPNLVKSYKIATTKRIKRECNSTAILAHRKTLLNSIKNIQWDLDVLCQEGLQAEIDEWDSRTCISRILKPSYSRISISELTKQGFRQYLVRKFQYHAREIFSGQSANSILYMIIENGNSKKKMNILPDLFVTLTELLQQTVKVPQIHSLTWSIKFFEQIYKVLDGSFLDSSIRLHLKPYKHHSGFIFSVSSKSISRLQQCAGIVNPIVDLFQTVPIIQLSGRKVIINQPIHMVSQTTPQPNVQSENPIVRCMGVDLGLKHFGVISIFEYDRLSGTKQEIGRHFLDQRRLLACKFNASTFQFSKPFRKDYNIKRKLEHLREQQRAHSSIWRQMKSDGGSKRSKRYYYAKKRYDFIWHKIRHIHSSLTQQVAHTITTIARAYEVSWIFFEDLRWSQQSPRNRVGRWLSHNQLHFFHSQVIKAVEDMAEMNPFQIKTVNARWSSQIAWTAQLKFNLSITYKTPRATIKPYLGNRTQKLFIYASKDPGLCWRGDSDLNAARNLALRGLLCT